MILITKRGTPPEQLVHEATCTHCKTEYEFTRDEAKYISDQRDGDCLKTSCPVCKRDVFTAANRGRVRAAPTPPPTSERGHQPIGTSGPVQPPPRKP